MEGKGGRQFPVPFKAYRMGTDVSVGAARAALVNQKPFFVLIRKNELVFVRSIRPCSRLLFYFVFLCIGEGEQEKFGEIHDKEQLLFEEEDALLNLHMDTVKVCYSGASQDGLS